MAWHKWIFIVSDGMTSFLIASDIITDSIAFHRGWEIHIWIIRGPSLISFWQRNARAMRHYLLS